MSEQAAPTQEQASAQSTPTLTAAEILLAIKDNFVVLSAVAAVVGITFATTFFGAYLAVFDWRLLWYVQYTDVLTFGVIAIGVISGSLATLQSFTQTILNVKNMEGRRKRWWIVGICLVVGFSTASNVWTAIHNGQPYTHILLGYAVLGFGLLIVLVVIFLISAGKWPTAVQCVMLMVSCTMWCLSFGQWLGLTVQQVGKEVEIVVKDKNLSGVKIIAILARHTMLLQNNVILVVPTADISEFKGPADATPKTNP
jgi:hypothetical protein